MSNNNRIKSAGPTISFVLKHWMQHMLFRCLWLLFVRYWFYRRLFSMLF